MSLTVLSIFTDPFIEVSSNILVFECPMLRRFCSDPLPTSQSCFSNRTDLHMNKPDARTPFKSRCNGT